MNCDELIADFEVSRASRILGVGRRTPNNELKYVIEISDELDPQCVDTQQARIFWSNLLFDYLLDKIEYYGLAPTDGRLINVLPIPPAGLDPKIICKYFEVFFRISKYHEMSIRAYTD